MVTKSASSEYVLSEVGIAAKQLKIEFRGRKTRLDALNLNYQLNDISLCLMQLSASDFLKTIQYENRQPDDSYICNFTKTGNENLAVDRLYIKFCLVENCGTIDLGSFHLTRF